MKNLTCIVCPFGCSLNIDEGTSGAELNITGNRCPRGITYAQEEILSPKRMVTATCQIKNSGPANNPRRIPVKTTFPCPREKIPALLEDIYKTTVTLPIKAGDAVIADWKGEGIKVVATRSLGE